MAKASLPIPDDTADNGVVVTAGEGSNGGNTTIPVSAVENQQCEPVDVIAPGACGATDANGATAEVGKIVFPPPSQWYRSTIAASRDEMWAYCSGSVITLVKPMIRTPPMNNSIAVNQTESTNNVSEDTQFEKIMEQKPSTDNSRWPQFALIGQQVDKYTSISFCQSLWNYLPVIGAPLVSGDERGLVRVWNLEQNATVIYHDNHAGNQIAGVDWSPNDHSLIFSIDDKGTMTVWNVINNTLRTLSFGKIVPTCLKASPHDTNVACFGTKGGNIFIVDTAGPTGKIISKMRHDEEVVGAIWQPKGDWNLTSNMDGNGKNQFPVLATTIHSMKLPSIRIWNQKGNDVVILQAWDKDTRSRSFKMFGNAVWARDPNSGRLMLVSSDRNGGIVSWMDSPNHDIIHTVHSHNAIFAMVQCGDVLWSMSYEPMIVGWNLRTLEIECIIPTFKGGSTISISPVDSCRLAIGGTDSVIRVLKCGPGYPSSGETATKAPHNSHRIKGKVTAIAWHPTRDNCLGFGTDEGMLGIYELKESNKFAMNFDRRVKGTAYTVTFGPPVASDDYKPSFTPNPNDQDSSNKKDKDGMMLYVCSGNDVFMVNPSRPTNPLINVIRIIEKSNPPKENDEDGGSSTIVYKAAEIRWSPDFSIFAIGYNDGRVELYSAPNLKLRCWIKCHVRAIQYLAWRESDFASDSSSNCRWLASTSNDGTARLYNLKWLFEKEFSNDETHELLISSEATLQGHGGLRVISCAWSPHDINLIVTVAYDLTAIVWNIEDGTRVARYMEHQHRLVACCFHPTDRFKVITMSDELSRDCAVHVWDYREHPFRTAAPKMKGCVPSAPIKAGSDSLRSIAVPQEEQPMTDDVVVLPMTNKGGIHVAKKGNENFQKPWIPKPKAVLPLTANGLINTKCNLTSELRHIVDKTPIDLATTKVQVQDTEGDNPSMYLGLLGDTTNCQTQLNLERREHDTKQNFEQAAFLSAWMSDKSWILQAIKNRQVTESMLPIAQFFSRQLYSEALKVLAEQNLTNRDYVKASTYFFILGDVDRAINVLVEKFMFREAVGLLKMNFPKNDERTTEVMKKWAFKSVSDGNFELASKIFCSIEQYGNALTAIEKRSQPYAYQAGCYIASKLKDEKKLEFFATKFILDGIIRGNYKECFDLLDEFPTATWMKSFIKIHKFITEFAKYIDGIKNSKEFGEWEFMLKNVVGEVIEHMAAIDGDTLLVEQKKILGNILVSIAQNEADAQHIICKNLTVLMIGVHDKDSAMGKGLEIIKLANNWLENKNDSLYFSVIMTTSLVPCLKDITDEMYSQTLSSAKLTAMKLAMTALVSKMEIKCNDDNGTNPEEVNDALVNAAEGQTATNTNASRE